MNTAVGLDNMAIAHEIAINSDFKLEKMEHPSQSLPKVVHDMMHQAFWDTLRESLNESPRNYHHALILLQEIKQVGIVIKMNFQLQITILLKRILKVCVFCFSLLTCFAFFKIVRKLIFFSVEFTFVITSTSHEIKI